MCWFDLLLCLVLFIAIFDFVCFKRSEGLYERSFYWRERCDLAITQRTVCKQKKCEGFEVSLVNFFYIFFNHISISVAFTIFR